MNHCWEISIPKSVWPNSGICWVSNTENQWNYLSNGQMTKFFVSLFGGYFEIINRDVNWRYWKDVIVKLDSSVKQLKEAIQTRFSLKQEKCPSEFPKVVNWRYVWRRYGLVFENEKLIDDDKQLRDYGVVSKSEIRFFKKSCSKKPSSRFPRDWILYSNCINL